MHVSKQIHVALKSNLCSENLTISRAKSVIFDIILTNSYEQPMEGSICIENHTSLVFVPASMQTA